jgi:myo-inositol-1(or 4)-monophosphatase
MASDDDEIAARYAFALRLIQEAGDKARGLFQNRKPGFELKGHQDYLTEADGELERLIRDRIAVAFPADTMIGEEGGGAASERVWVVDPLDGTSNFARGIPYFAVSIAFVFKGAPTLGVIINPMARELFAARAGHGATLNGKPMRVSTTSDFKGALVELGFSNRRPFSDYTSMVTRVMAAGAGVLRQGSGALALAYVAAGRTDGYAELFMYPWDVLAALVMVREAGGWTGDYMAGDVLKNGNPMLACTPALQESFNAAARVFS